MDPTDLPTHSLTLPRAEHERAARLVVVEGGTSSVVELPRAGELLIGRAPDVGLKLEDAAASRHHARLTAAEGEVTLTDLDSHNGTRINGERVTVPRLLASGDVIAIGDVVLVLHEAPRTPRAHVPLALAPVRKRLAEEVQRSVEYERPLAFVVLITGLPVGDARAHEALEGSLRAIDVLGNCGDTQLCVLMPELHEDSAHDAARRMLDALSQAAPGARAGVASCPDDATSADALLSAARSAAMAAASGQVFTAGNTTRTLELGDRRVLLAEAAMIQLYDLLRRLAASDLSVLIAGETGAGKENAAFAVHHWSSRTARAFVTVNCAALPDTLIESELFGYERGAFTGANTAKPGLFEQADGGTLFLDEVGELSAAAQAKLLRALESKRVARLGAVKDRAVDLRVVAASNRDLREEVKAGRFRSDLLFRIAAATVVLPPLRERPREVALLSRHFLDEACRKSGRTPPRIGAMAAARLAHHDWPGNLRELKNVMDFVAATALEDTVELLHLPHPLSGLDAADPMADVAPAALVRRKPLADELRDLERRRMQEALDAAGGVQKRAAELVSMPLRTFAMKMKQYGLSVRRG